MQVVIHPSRIHGAVRAPPSKSYTHRAVIIGSLSDNCVIRNALISDDTSATIDACRTLGANISGDDATLEINGIGGCPQIQNAKIDCRNSGTTLRLMLPVATLSGADITFTGDNSLQQRPNSPLLDALWEMGVTTISSKDDGCAPIAVNGCLKGGIANIDGSISSQFISGLLVACPLAEDTSIISIKGRLKSRPYVEMTLEMLERAGAEIHRNFRHLRQFNIPGKQQYSLREFVVPGDFSSAAYLLAAAAILNSELEIENLPSSKQSDIMIGDILKQMGADITLDRKRAKVILNGADLHGVRVDLGDAPDLLPVIATLGSYASGVTEVINASHVRYKETDRIKTISSELKKMGVKIDEREDGVIVKGGRVKGAHVTSHGDHRIAMSLTVAALGAKGDTVIDDADCVSVSYPGFYHDLEKLGASIDMMEAD